MPLPSGWRMAIFQDLRFPAGQWREITAGIDYGVFNAHLFRCSTARSMPYPLPKAPKSNLQPDFPRSKKAVDPMSSILGFCCNRRSMVSGEVACCHWDHCGGSPRCLSGVRWQG